MKYMGSKNRIAKYILPIMLSERKSEQWWVEPFVGGANIIDKVGGLRIGADVNPYLIDALVAIRDCVELLPKNNIEFSETDYRQLKENDDYKYKGFAGFAYSYGGKWLGGWRRDKARKRDYVKEAYCNAKKQSPFLKGVKLINESYLNLVIPENSLIYCDPPYEGTTGYKHNFEHDIFWEWCRNKSHEGHTVFVSEYNAPNDFECLWQKSLVSSLTKNTGSKIGIEKLFKYKNIKRGKNNE